MKWVQQREVVSNLIQRLLSTYQNWACQLLVIPPMASSSSSSSIKHDVVLSFTGEDTRRTFTSHLFAALCRKNIDSFIDDEEIKKGDEMSPTILAAIEGS